MGFVKSPDLSISGRRGFESGDVGRGSDVRYGEETADAETD